jgi:hypothetical protein
MLPEFCGQANARTPRLHKMWVHPILVLWGKRIVPLRKKRVSPPIRPMMQTHLSHFHSLSIRLPIPLVHLESALRRRRRRTLTHTPGIPAPLLEPLAGTHIEIAIQLRTRFFPVYEVAEAAADTALAAVQPAACLAEIGDGRQFAVDGAAGVPAGVECVAGFLAVFFVLEAHVYIADEIFSC